MKRPRLERVKLKAEILTPIHIGDGSDLEPLEYVIVDENLYKIDTAGFLSSLPPEASIELSTLLKGKMDRVTLVKIRKLIQEHFDPEMGFIWKSKVTPAVAHIHKTRFDAPENQILVNPFIRTDDKPFIPGSSLKGAIRTALLNQWSTGLQKTADGRNARLTEAEILKATSRRQRDNKLMPSIDKDLFRAFRVEDVSLPEDSMTYSKVSNWTLSREGVLRETPIQMIRELTSSTISSGKTFNIDVHISIDNRFLSDRRSGLGRNDLSIEATLKACDSFYQRVLLDEKKRLFGGKSNEAATVSEKVLDAASGGTLLRVGWASGFDAMTIFNFRSQSARWSKRLAEDKYPLGWIRLSQ